MTTPKGGDMPSISPESAAILRSDGETPLTDLEERALRMRTGVSVGDDVEPKFRGGNATLNATLEAIERRAMAQVSPAGKRSRFHVVEGGGGDKDSSL